MEENYYTLDICGLQRKLPLIAISEDLTIASFVILGDTVLVATAAQELVKKLPEVDALVTAEAKGIPLIYEMSKLLGMDKYFVARKSIKSYMKDPITVEVDSITTQGKQILCLDGNDSAALKGKRVAIVDDVISTGQSLLAVEELLSTVGAQVVAKVAILAEGDAMDRSDIIYLEDLPVFPQS